MSVRRAIELNFKNRLEAALAGSKYKVVESLRTEERPMPCVVVIAGSAANTFEGQPQADGNYSVDLSILILSSIDSDTIDEHSDATQRVLNVMNMRDTRKVAVVDGLYLYDVVKTNAGEDNQDRKMGSGLNYRAIVAYFPVSP